MRPFSSSSTLMSRVPERPKRKRWSAPYVESLERYWTTDSSEVPTGLPVLTTKRSKSSLPR